MIRNALVVAPVLALGLVSWLSAPAVAAQKQPPACAAISFKPLEGTMTTNPETAGHYRSRFGTIDLMGALDNGKANYKVQVNRKALTPISGEIPKSTYSCLNAKHVKTPPQSVGGACDGSRFRVAIDSAGKQKLIMLFALKGEDWKLCEAGTPQ